MSHKKRSVPRPPVGGAATVEKATLSLASLEKQSIARLEGALAAVRDLSAARLDAKLSVSRLTGVARELRELIKVMSVYGC